MPPPHVVLPEGFSHKIAIKDPKCGGGVVAVSVISGTSSFVFRWRSLIRLQIQCLLRLLMITSVSVKFQALTRLAFFMMASWDLLWRKGCVYNKNKVLHDLGGGRPMEKTHMQSLLPQNHLTRRSSSWRPWAILKTTQMSCFTNSVIRVSQLSVVLCLYSNMAMV